MLLVHGDYEKICAYSEKMLRGDFFRFTASYASHLGEFTDIARFCWESRREKAPFRNKYQGPCVIDLSEWNNEPLNIYFKYLMYFFYDYSHYSPKSEVIFIIDCRPREQLLNAVKSVFGAEKVKTVELKRAAKPYEPEPVPIGFRYHEPETARKSKEDGNVRSKV